MALSGRHSKLEHDVLASPPNVVRELDTVSSESDVETLSALSNVSCGIDLYSDDALRSVLFCDSSVLVFVDDALELSSDRPDGACASGLFLEFLRMLKHFPIAFMNE